MMPSMAMSPSTLDSILSNFAGNPFLLFMALLVLTFIFEDAVVVATGLLAGKMLIDPSITLLALVIGTLAGDIGLHAAGRWLANWRYVQKLRTPAVERLEGRLQRHGLWAVAMARFVPGTRLPVFLASGLFRVPSGPTTLVITGTTILWTPFLFLVSYGAADNLIGKVNPAMIAGGVALVIALIAAPRLIAARKAKPA